MGFPKRHPSQHRQEISRSGPGRACMGGAGSRSTKLDGRHCPCKLGRASTMDYHALTMDPHNPSQTMANSTTNQHILWHMIRKDPFAAPPRCSPLQGTDAKCEMGHGSATGVCLAEALSVICHRWIQLIMCPPLVMIVPHHMKSYQVLGLPQQVTNASPGLPIPR